MAVQGVPRACGDEVVPLRGSDTPPAQNATQGAIVSRGETPDGVPLALARILRPNAATRWMMPALSSITPQYVESVLRGALGGSHVQQWELFDLMMETWPELAGCIQELTEGVMSRKLIFTAYAEEGDPPTESALEKQILVSTALRRMEPDVCADENDLEDTLKDILDGWFRGVVCLETEWHVINTAKQGSIIGPRATFWAHPSHFAWGVDGRLGLKDARGIAPLPPHKFLVGIHKAKSGSALGGAILRALAWWWTASNFASDWVLNLAQLFGLPFRWANYDPNAPQGTVDAICNMLQNMGSAGWAAFPAGTTLEMKDSGAKGDNSPQADLLDRADRYARMLILGQTMSGSQDSSKGGGKAFGAVEADVKTARIDAAAKYACKVLSGQLIPSIVELNYSNRDECPEATLITDTDAGPEEATRDETLSRMMPIPLSYLRQKYNVPEAAAGEETTQGAWASRPPLPKTEDRRQEDDAEDDDLTAKLAALASITDDALFAKQLANLTDSLQ